MSDQDRDEYVSAAALVFEDRQAPASEQEALLQSLGSTLIGEFARAETDRQKTEQRWLCDLRQYRGQYDPETEAAIGKARSRAFVRKTRVKIKTIDSRVADLLFPTGADKNWAVEETPKPTIAPEQRAEIIRDLKQQAMAQLQQQAQAQLQQMVGQGSPEADARAQIEQQMGPLIQQAGGDPPVQLIEQMAKRAAKAAAVRMSEVIEDQLVEARYKQVALKTIHSGHLYGAGILKGPLVDRRIRTRFVKEGGKWVSKSESYVIPFIDFVPLWRFYPDMSATDLSACRFVFERHTMTRHEMSGLAERKSFAKGRQHIIDWIKANPKGHATPRYWDNELRNIGERDGVQGDPGGTYEVLERWGWLNGEQLSAAGVNVPEDRMHEAFFSNVWMLPNGTIIKVALQQIDGVTWPYFFYYFDKDESTIFPEGLASIMRDDQEMLNAATRIMIDNAAITSGGQLEVTPHLLSTTEKVDEFIPWKVWLRNNLSPGSPAIREIRFNSNVGELSKMAAMFENNADETTAIPRYMSGENATSGAAGTSSGLSMLMGAVNIVTKDLITSYDEGITVGFIRGVYSWNMKFNPDDTIKGDYDVKATGSASLVAKEVRARQLNEFAQLTANPLDDPWIKRGVLNKMRAEANELIDCVKTQEEFDAEQNSPQNITNMQIQQQLLVGQLQDLMSKIQKTAAETEKAMAGAKLIEAQTVSAKVSSAYAALQAGGVATSQPTIAPAGDEILRSAGWVDATPDPSIAQLNGPPVQDDQGTATKMGKGQAFVVEPRGDTDPMTPQTPNEAAPQQQPSAGSPDAASGMDGLHGGMETQRI